MGRASPGLGDRHGSSAEDFESGVVFSESSQIQNICILPLCTRRARRRARRDGAVEAQRRRAAHHLGQLYNVLDPRVALDFSSASLGLREPTQAQRQQLRADHEVVAALCRKMGMRSCKEMREAKHVDWRHIDRSATDLAMLGKLSSVLPALERLYLSGSTVGVLRLAAELGTRALPAVTTLAFSRTRVGNAGASALAAALGRGALPRLKTLTLNDAAIGDVGLVALAPALRLRPALEALDLSDNPLAALVAPPR